MNQGKMSFTSNYTNLFPQGISIDSDFCSLPIGIWEEHPDSTKNVWSNSIFIMLDIKKSDSENPSLALILKGIQVDERKAFANWLNLVKDGKADGPALFELTYRSSRASAVHLILNAEPVVANGEGNVFWRGTLQDVTMARLCENGFKSYVKNALNYFEKFPLMMFILDNTGKLRYWNSECEKITGYKFADASAGKEVFKILFPKSELRKKLRGNVQDKSLQSYDEEFEIETRRGRKFLSKWTVFHFQNAEGENNIAAIGRDISRQVDREKSLSKKLQQSNVVSKIAANILASPFNENLFRSLGSTLDNNTNDFYIIVSSLDPDQQFFTIEGGFGFGAAEWHQAYEIIGWNPLGRRFQLPPESYAVAKSPVIQVIEGTIYAFSDGIITSAASRALERLMSIERIYTVGLVHNDLFMGWVLLIAKSAEVEDQIPLIQQIVNLYALGLYRQRDALLLNNQKIAAEESNRQMTAYLASIGHEIRTPLNAILGFSQLLSIPRINADKKKQYIKIINGKGRMLVKLINDMVDVSRVESGQLTVVKQLFSPNRLLKSLFDFYNNERLFQLREAVNLKLSIPDNDDLIIYSDEGRLEQVFTNLLDNALKFTSKGFIEFGYRVEEPNVIFYVKDTGIGIDKSMHTVVFDRYKQLNQDIARAREGKGLGLAICKGIVELLDGEIWVESELDQGATFWFTIPMGTERMDDKQSAQVIDKEYELYPDWKNKVLLIAEDEDINYHFLIELLEPTGVNMLWAKDGAQAVDLVDSIKNIDAILMDIRMPNKDGYAATLEIRQIKPDIPIVALTAYAFANDKAKALAAGCDEFIAKPINSKELMNVLNGYLG